VTASARLGVIAFVLATGALFAGNPTRVAPEPEAIDAAALADWIRNQRADLRVIDLRAAWDFDAFHIPSAVSVPLGLVSTTAASPSETIVLYGGDDDRT
jgi:hypothetical protein